MSYTLNLMNAQSICRTVVVGFGLILVSGQSVFPQNKSASQNSQESPEQIQLINAQKAEAEAQAEYYRELTNRVRHPEQSPTPRKTIRDSFVENPVVLAALLAALVGLLTLTVNNRNSTRARRNTEFYEALKRYGDKDSPTIRSSAAGLLGQMGQVWAGRPRATSRFPFVRRNYPYLDTALDQLVTGLLLEENPVAVASTRNALGLLIPFTPNKAASKLHEVNSRLQEELAASLAQYFVELGHKAVPPTSLDDRQHFSLWEQVGSLIGEHHGTLRDFVERSGSLSRFLSSYLQAHEAQAKGYGMQLPTIQERIRDVSRRLKADADLLSMALRQSRWDSHQWFNGSFLVSADLSDADLSHVDFHGSFMVAAWFLGSKLSQCSFIEADLRGAAFHDCNLSDAWFTRAKLDLAGFDKADLTNAKLAEAKVEDVNKFRTANWWKADFYFSIGRGKTDTRLLKRLFQEFRALVPEDSHELHSSVRDYLGTQRLRLGKIQEYLVTRRLRSRKTLEGNETSPEGDLSLDRRSFSDETDQLA